MMYMPSRFSAGGKQNIPVKTRHCKVPELASNIHVFMTLVYLGKGQISRLDVLASGIQISFVLT